MRRMPLHSARRTTSSIRKRCFLPTSWRLRSTGLVTTDAVILEIGNSLSKQRYRAAAIQLIASLMSDPAVKVVSLSPQLLSRGHPAIRPAGR